MIQGKTILALITARGGSKGLPGKNIRPLKGKPLISWTIEAARGSKYVDRILVTTDTAEIAAAAREFGAEVPFLRPPELAGDSAKQEDAVLHAMQWAESNGGEFDYLMMLAPTHPLRDTREIDALIEDLSAHPQAKSMFTVMECEQSPLHMNKLPEDLCLDGFIPDDIKTRNRQELPTYYKLSGSIVMIEWSHFKKYRTFLAPQTYAYVTTPRKGHDIDSMKDFLVAELYLEHPELEPGRA